MVILAKLTIGVMRKTPMVNHGWQSAKHIAGVSLRQRLFGFQWQALRNAAKLLSSKFGQEWRLPTCTRQDFCHFGTFDLSANDGLAQAGDFMVTERGTQTTLVADRHTFVKLALHKISCSLGCLQISVFHIQFPPVVCPHRIARLVSSPEPGV